MAAKKKKKRSTAKKKSTSKKTSAKKRTTRTKTQKTTPVTINIPPYPQQRQIQKEENTQVNKMLIENFVSLQKVLTNLSTKMDGLTTQLTKLLDLFEISAKSLADREFEIEKDNKETLEKLNVLLDQNKVLARGLSLMHERMPQDQFPHPPQNFPQQMQQTLPPTIPQNKKSSPMTKELTPSPPPFQPPKMNFPTPPKPKAPGTFQEGTPSIMSNEKGENEKDDNFDFDSYSKNKKDSEIPKPEDFGPIN